MREEEGPFVLAIAGGAWDGVAIPLPGVSFEDLRAACCCIEAGDLSDPAVRRIEAALEAGLGPRDQWGLGDELALRLEVETMTEGSE